MEFSSQQGDLIRICFYFFLITCLSSCPFVGVVFFFATSWLWDMFDGIVTFLFPFPSSFVRIVHLCIPIATIQYTMIASRAID